MGEGSCPSVTGTSPSLGILTQQRNERELAPTTGNWAKAAIAQEDARTSMLRPVETTDAEPIQAVINQREFPTLTDQGEQRNCGEIADDPAAPPQARETRRKMRRKHSIDR